MRANLEAERGMNGDSGDRSIVQSFNPSITQSLTSLAEAIGVAPDPALAGIEIRGVTQDSREVTAGYLFVAIKGFVADGHRFIDDAVSRGAAAVVAEENVSCSVPFFCVRNGRIALAQLSAAFFSYPTRDLFTDRKSVV